MSRSSKRQSQPAQKSGSNGKTPAGTKIGNRSRSAVLKDFERIAGPLRGRNQDDS